MERTTFVISPMWTSEINQDLEDEEKNKEKK